MIVVGGLIVLSIIVCIVRCACCGMSCCCSCFSCCKCCGNCCGCFDPPEGSKRANYLEEPYVPPNHGFTNQGYASHPPMTTGTAAFHSQKSSPPQYAEFDVSKKGGEDALPAMPSWESSKSQKVLLEDEGVELEQLKKNPAAHTSQTNVPLMAGGAGSAGPASPVSSTHRQQFPPHTGSNGYQDQYSIGGAAAGSLGRQSPYGNMGYGQESQRDADSYGRSSPQGAYGQQQPTNPLDLGFQRSASPQTYDNGYAHQSSAVMGAITSSGRSGPSPPSGMRWSPGPQPGGDYFDQGPSTANSSAYRNGSHSNEGGYGYDQQKGTYGQQALPYPPGPQRSHTADPQRQYTGESGTGQQLQSFDFSSSGYSRPKQPERTDIAEKYPGMKPYQHQQQGW